MAELRDRHGWFLPYSPEAGCVRDFAFLGSRGYAAVEVGGLLRSDDGGVRWALAGGSDGEPRFGAPAPDRVHPDVHSVLVHPSSPDRLFAVTAGGLFASEDGGATFRLVRGGCYCRAAWVDPDDADHLLLGVADGVRRKNGRIERTRDGGRSWRREPGAEGPWPEAMVERFAAGPDALVAVRSDGAVLELRAGEPRWRELPYAGRARAAAWA